MTRAACLPHVFHFTLYVCNLVVSLFLCATRAYNCTSQLNNNNSTSTILHLYALFVLNCNYLCLEAFC